MTNPYSANILLQLHMTGSDSSTTFLDTSLFPKTVTANGNARISTAQSKFGSGSGYFDGSGDRLSLAASSIYNLGNTYTIRFHLYPLSLPGTGNSCRLILVGANNTASGLILYIDNTGKMGVGIPYGGTNGMVSSGSVVSINAWHHYEIDVDNGVGKIFVDGVSQSLSTSTITAQTAGTNQLFIGYDTVGTVNYNYYGYIQDLEIIAGVAIHNANFTAPTTLLPDPDPVSGLVLPRNKIITGDRQDGGGYHIPLNVDELGLAGSYRTRLYDRYSGRLVREQWSGADGAVDFQYLAYRNAGYYATAHDHTAPLREAAIADFLTPELMAA